MTSVGVSSIGSMLKTSQNLSVSQKSDVSVNTFDETLNNLKSDNGIKSQPEKAEVNKSEDSSFEADTKKLDAPAKKEAIKKENEPTDEQIAAVAEEVISQVKEAIQQQFNVTEEELSSVMESLGIKDENLLDVSSLTKIVMKLSGDLKQSDLLTNPNFAKDLKELLATVENIKEDVAANMADMEANKLPEAEELVHNTEEQNVTDEKDVTDVRENDSELQTENEDSDVEVNMEDSSTEELNGLDEGAATTQDAFKESSEGQSDGALKHNEPKTDKVSLVEGNQAISPQDFAARLTEDLSARVGDENATEIVKQVVEQVQVQAKQGVKSLEMQLYPEHLGKVFVQIVSKDGAITAQITAETEAAKSALESQLTILKENLNNQGVKIENVEVTIASHAFEQNMQGERGQEQEQGKGNRGRRAERILNEGFMEEVKEEPDIMEFRGNTVSYSA